MPRAALRQCQDLDEGQGPVRSQRLTWWRDAGRSGHKLIYPVPGRREREGGVCRRARLDQSPNVRFRQPNAIADPARTNVKGLECGGGKEQIKPAGMTGEGARAERSFENHARRYF